MYGTGQKESNKRVAAVLENAPPCASLFSHSVHPQCAPHFDGRATVRRLVKRHNPRIAVLFAVKMRRSRRIAAHLANFSRAFEIWCSEKDRVLCRTAK